MASDKLENTLMTFVNEELLADRDVSLLKEDTPLLGGDAVNSLAMMRLIMFIETQLEVSIPLVDIVPENFANVSVLSEYIRTRSAQHALS